MASTTLCNARSQPHPVPGCCGHTLSPEPACRNCGQVPSHLSPYAAEAVDLCLRPWGHRGRHSWVL